MQTLPFVVSIKPNFFTVYPERCGSGNHQKHENSISNLSENQHNGALSNKAQRKIQTALDWLLFISKPKSVINPTTNTVFSFNLAMLTLTLPCAQAHTDQHIKNKMLNSFLTTMRTKFYLTNYIWKAEKTEAGNLHFHIIIDRFIEHKEVNRIWNNVLKVNGYIARYREKMLIHHKNGFTPFKSLLPSWSLQNQMKAYKKAKQSNFMNPSGTTDIHSLKSIKNANAYLKKYMQKNPDQTKLYSKIVSKYCSVNAVSSPPPEILIEIKAKIILQMAVKGCIWFVSRSLSALKGAKDNLHYKLHTEIELVKKVFPDKVITKDFCEIFLIDIETLNIYGFKIICGIFIQYVLEVRKLFYPKREDSPSFAY